MRHEALVTSGACPSRDQMVALLTDDLPADASSLLEDHLETCAACQGSLLELAGRLDLGPVFGSAETATDGASTILEEPRTDFLLRLASLTLLEPGKTTTPEFPRDHAAEVMFPGIDILEEIGRGTSAVVYLAREKEMNRLIALKVIPAVPLLSQLDRERARRSVDAVTRVQHPNIVESYYVGRHDRWLFGVLEYLEGGTLSDRLTGIPWQPAQAAQLIFTLARAAAYAHAQGFVHGDLKPISVLFKADGTPKLADFGLARSFAEGDNLTVDGETLGTPCYMAPEQAMGKRHLGPGVDVYALGAILYELLSGKPPFQGTTKLNTLYQAVHLPPVPVGRLQPGVPRDLARICMRCLEKAPEARYASAGHLADDLERLLESKPIRPNPLTWPRRLRVVLNNHPFMSFVAGILLLVALLEFIGMWALWMEVQESGHLNRNQAYFSQINSLSVQLNQAQTVLAAELPDLAEYDIKAGKKEHARALLLKVPTNMRDARWEKLLEKCGGPEVEEK